MRISLIVVAIVVSVSGCSSSTFEIPGQADPENPPIIPLPVTLSPSGGQFHLSATTTLAVAGSDTALHTVGRTAAGILGVRFLYDFLSPSRPTDTNTIIFRISGSIAHPEGYRISTTQRSITIESASPVGAFYAVQTLRQLLSPAAFTRSGSGNWSGTVPCGTIEDHPRFGYRGMHLDVGRHFFPVTFIKEYIDLLALYKFNTFHWHLTEDQGWRIEIRKYPKLTGVGSRRKETLLGHYSDQPERYDGKPYGGFYTQEEVREVVAYARERFITVIPEIEMPGHALAALSAYPEYSCTYGQFEPATKWGVFEDIFCGKDSTFGFLEDILTEVMDLFPGQFIHIGGDEAPKTRWESCPRCAEVRSREGLKDTHEQQSYFIGRIGKFLNAHGRRLIGWDEILEGGLAPDATVMSWRGEVGGVAAARQGHDVIMSPTSHLYFDFYQGYSSDEPLAIGSYLPVRKVYDYNPIPTELNPQEARRILGAQGNVWTEYMPTEEHVEYMVLPRLTALAEVVWSPQEARDFDDFADRLARSFWRFDSLGLTYASHLLDVDHIVGPADHGAILMLTSIDKESIIRYTTDGSEPTSASTIYQTPFPLMKDMPIRAARFKGRRRSKNILSFGFMMHKAVGKPIGLDALPHPTFGYRGRGALVNGILGNGERFADGEWLGWYRWNMDAVIDLLGETSVDSVSIRIFCSVPEWLWLPRKVEVSASDNGKDFTPVAEFSAFDYAATQRVVRVTLPLHGLRTEYLRVFVPNYGIIPDGSPGAGNYTWLFVDEIVVK